MSVAATILVVLVVGLWGLAIYKRLVRYRTAVRTAWGRLDEARGRRRDASAAIARSASIAGEGGAVAAVISALQHAAAARGPTDAAVREAALSGALTHLLAAIDREPAAPRQDDRRRELALAETALAEAATSYNETASAYNRAIAAAPDSLIAAMVSYSPAERFDARRS
jgi:hypothetical protein